MRAVATVVLATCVVAPAALGEPADVVAFTPRGAGTRLPFDNPARLPLGGVTAGATLGRNDRKSTLDRTDADGDKLTTKAREDSAGLVFGKDVGAGMALGVSGQGEWREISTDVTGTRKPIEESMRMVEGDLRAALELTTGLNAGLLLRERQESATIFGSSQNVKATRYKVVMPGFAAGLAYEARGTQYAWGLGWAYYPPLRGKTTAAEQDLLVAESGRLLADAHFAPSQLLNLTLSVERYLPETDDFVLGTTADDDQTDISLRGLDVDQYLVPRELIALGVDYKLAGPWLLRGVLGRERSDYSFDASARVRGLGNGGRDAVEASAWHARAGIDYVQGKAHAEASYGLLRR
jgi:hypothetical protein